MVAPQHVTERRVTRPSNTTARPGLPDKPAPKHTSEQKCADEEQVRQRKEAKKTAKEDAYQRISTMQAQMVVDQSEALKDQAPMCPKPRVVKKNRPAIEEKEPIILPPRNPRPESSKEPSLREVLADVTCQRLAKVKARAEASRNSGNQQATKLDSCSNSKGLTNSNLNAAITNVDDDSDELWYAMEHYKGNAKLLPAEVVVAHADVNELASLMDPGNQTPQREQVSLKRKFDSQSDLEGDEVTTELASKGEAMETDFKPRGAGRWLTQQNAIAIIEAPPIKKIKTKSVEGADNVGQSITGNAPSGEIATTPACVSMKFYKGSSIPPKNARTKARKGNLPPLMQNDPDGKWTKNVLPSIILWYGDQASIWNIKDSDLEHVLISIVGIVYPLFADIDEMKQGGHIYDLAVQRLVRWHHVIGNAAGHVVLTYLNENATVDEGLTKEALATLLLKGHAFAYADFDPTDHSKAFQSDLILSLLGMTHLQDTIGWVEVPGLDLLQKCDHGIRGVLSLCTTALEHALKLAEEGQLETTVNHDSETQASQEAPDGANPAPTRSIRANWKQPHTLNHATGKLSTKGSAFSHQNWGGQTTSYYVSIANWSAEMLGDVVARALLYLATRPDDDAQSTPSVMDELDPRAQMCKPVLAPHDYSETMWVTL